jgi:predicted aldo/keto reductase-like oxidoreductase
MRYRRFGKLNWKVSVLGFGAMRLPLIAGDVKINEPIAIRMMRYAIDNGINYIDTAYPYHRGTSEILVGKVLQDGYRKKIKLATKMPSWLVNSQQDMDKYLNEQLGKLQVDYVDFYLLHGLNRGSWSKLQKFEVTKWAEKKIDEGKIKHLGFSFHDEYPVFKEIIDSYNKWVFCQIQYNYTDTEYQAGTKGLIYAASKGLGIVVMEPLAGGNLAVKPPSAIQTLWDRLGVKSTPARLALQWVWNRPEVSVVLSGMSTMKQVIENLETAEHSGPGTLSKKELNLVNQIVQKYRELGYIGCTGCGYCMPCPEGVNIPQIIALYNEYYAKDRDNAIKKKYKKNIPSENQAKKCVRCGRCETLCPQQLPIMDTLNRIAFVFEQ